MEKDSARQRAISILSEEIVKNRLVVFIGAGCSVSDGRPSWKELIHDLLKQYNVETRETDLLRLATRLERDVGKLRLCKSIAERLQTRPDTKSLLHNSIVRLSVNLFITTNYDHLLEDSFRENGFLPMVISRDKDLSSIDPGKKTIVKLHGDIDAVSSMIISKKAMEASLYYTVLKRARFPIKSSCSLTKQFQTLGFVLALTKIAKPSKKISRT